MILILTLTWWHFYYFEVLAATEKSFHTDLTWSLFPWWRCTMNHYRAHSVCVCVCFLLLALLCVFVVFLYMSVGRLGVSVLLMFYIWYVFIERLWRTGCDAVGEEVVLDAAVCNLFVCGENNWTVFQMKTAQSDDFILEFCDCPSVCVPKRSRRFYRVSGGFNDGQVFLVRQNSDQLWLLCSL